MRAFCLISNDSRFLNPLGFGDVDLSLLDVDDVVLGAVRG